MNGRWTLPNLLGLFRLAATGVIVFLLLAPFPGAGLAAFLLFVPAALSDLLDGWLARRNDQVTTFGVFLDLTADKVLVAGILIALLPSGLVAPVLVIVIVLRDFVVGGVRQVAAVGQVVVGSELVGKSKTVVTLVAIAPLLLAFDAQTGGPMAAVGHGATLTVVGAWLLLAGTTLAVLSGIDYLVKAWPILTATPRSEDTASAESPPT